MAKFCVGCGSRLVEGDLFCTQCGTKAAVEQTEPAAAPPPPSPPLTPDTSSSPAVMPASAASESLGRSAPRLGGVLVLCALAFLGGAAIWGFGHLPALPTIPSTPAATMTATSPTTTAKPPVAGVPASKAGGSGTWRFSSTEDGVQVLWTRAGASNDDVSPARLTCNGDDGVVSFLAMVPEGDSDKVAEEAGRHIILSGGGVRREIIGYLGTSPGEMAIGFELDNTSALHATIGAADFTVTTPVLEVRAGPGERAGLDSFLKACPPASPPPSDQSPGWRTVTRPTQGVRLDVPAGLFRLTAADRTGRAWEARNGKANLTFFARANATDAKFPDAAIEDQPTMEKVTFKTQGTNWVAISGVEGGRIMHYMGRLTCGGSDVADFTIAYEPSEATLYDPLVRRMAQSFIGNTMLNGRSLCP